MAFKKYYLDKRATVNGRVSQINMDNMLDLSDYIARVVTGSTSSSFPLVFQNGLTKDAFGNIELGGTLAKDTAIALGGNLLKLSELPLHDDDIAAGAAGLTEGDLYQTTGAGAAPLNVAGILMVKQ